MQLAKNQTCTVFKIISMKKKFCRALLTHLVHVQLESRRQMDRNTAFFQKPSVLLTNTFILFLPVQTQHVTCSGQINISRRNVHPTPGQKTFRAGAQFAMFFLLLQRPEMLQLVRTLLPVSLSQEVMEQSTQLPVIDM